MRFSKWVGFPCAIVAIGLLGVSAVHADTTVYSNNFSSGAGTEWSDPTTSTSNGEKFLADSANGSGNGTNTLSLSGLAAHTTVTVSFDLYIIQSMDGNGPAGGGPDEWKLTSSGSSSQTLIDTSFANYTGGNTQSFGGSNGSGGYLTSPIVTGDGYAPRTGESDGGHLGFGTGDYGDATYSLSFTFSDTGSSLALAFDSLQNQSPGDEGWGLDNVVVSTNGPLSIVPAPAAVWSGLALLGGMALWSLQSRRQSA